MAVTSLAPARRAARRETQDRTAPRNLWSGLLAAFDAFSRTLEVAAAAEQLPPRRSAEVARAWLAEDRAA